MEVKLLSIIQCLLKCAMVQCHLIPWNLTNKSISGGTCCRTCAGRLTRRRARGESSTRVFAHVCSQWEGRVGQNMPNQCPTLPFYKALKKKNVHNGDKQDAMGINILWLMTFISLCIISADRREHLKLDRISPKTAYVLGKNVIHFLWIYGVCPVFSGTRPTWKTPRTARKVLVAEPFCSQDSCEGPKRYPHKFWRRSSCQCHRRCKSEHMPTPCYLVFFEEATLTIKEKITRISENSCLEFRNNYSNLTRILFVCQRYRGNIKRQELLPTVAKNSTDLLPKQNLHYKKLYSETYIIERPVCACVIYIYIVMYIYIYIYTYT